MEPPDRENTVASAISCELTQNAEMAAATAETSTVTTSAGPPPPTSVRANVVASKVSGDSTQKLPGLSPKNAEIAAATTEISTANSFAATLPPT